jgi:hypothetical protein
MLGTRFTSPPLRISFIGGYSITIIRRVDLYHRTTRDFKGYAGHFQPKNREPLLLYSLNFLKRERMFITTQKRTR